MRDSIRKATLGVVLLVLWANTLHPSPTCFGQDTNPPKTLDELLGIAGEPSSATVPENNNDLSQALSDEKPLDTLRRARVLMDSSSSALSRADLSVSTQRLQENAIKLLDAMIQDAQRRQQQGQGSGQQSQSQQQPQQGESAQPQQSNDPGDRQGSKQAKSNERDGDAKRSDEGSNKDGAPPPSDGTVVDADGALETDRIEWGSLPPRIREVLRQGLRERMSTPYRAWTEAYFRRIAEDSRE
ncbi:MAG: hypothetical protein O2800_01320 [Planctomycetota bacterium]|nr:hypothetical protein [Planctomycetota bacterium]